jgi:hypothetical protein
MKDKATGNPMQYRGEIGNTDDIRCKANMIKRIDKRTCRNNCKQWNHKENKCDLGYGYSK